MTYVAVKFKLLRLITKGGDAFTRKYNIWHLKVTRNVAQFPLHRVTYAATKFEVARSNGLGNLHLQET